MNIIEKIKDSKEKLKNRLVILSGTIFSTLAIAESRVYAADTTSIDSFIDFACDWLTKIGGIIALVRWSYVCTRLAKRRCRRKIKRAYDFNGRIYASCNFTI